MADFLSGAMGEGDLRAEQTESVAPIADKFPMIAKLLMGDFDGDGAVNRTPGNIRVFTNAGRIKLMIYGQEWAKTGYVTMPEGVLDFEVVEKMLREGKIDWSKAKGPKMPLTEVPH